MLSRLFPLHLDNDYPGHPLALWFFYPIAFLTVMRSCLHVFLPDGGAQSIATIPLDAMTPSGESTVILVFGLWGLSQLVVSGVYVLALWRYRTMLPLLYLLLFIEYGGRLGLSFWKPIETAETPPGATLNYVLAPTALLMLYLSTRDPDAPGDRAVS